MKDGEVVEQASAAADPRRAARRTTRGGCWRHPARLPRPATTGVTRICRFDAIGRTCNDGAAAGPVWSPQPVRPTARTGTFVCRSRRTAGTMVAPVRRTDRPSDPPQRPEPRPVPKAADADPPQLRQQQLPFSVRRGPRCRGGASSLLRLGLRCALAAAASATARASRVRSGRARRAATRPRAPRAS